ncbi:unnamed protein product [Trichobilharzia regenti]|nr:unnamed protein product [Trichobilharzia regenti]
MYHEVPTCHITTGYYVGFSYMMMHSYQDAVSTLLSTLAYKSRAIGLISQRADLKEYVNKQADQMMSFDETEFASSFDLGCPKFISPETPYYAKPQALSLPSAMDSVSPLDSQRQQIDLFKSEIVQQIELLRLRSFLKLYTNMSASKLASFMNMVSSHVVYLFIYMGMLFMYYNNIWF